LYSEDTQFESWPGYWLTWLTVLWFSSLPPSKFQDSTLKQAMTTSFQFLTYLSFMIIFASNSITYIAYAIEKALLNNILINQTTQTTGERGEVGFTKYKIITQKIILLYLKLSYQQKLFSKETGIVINCEIIS
jgi:hypothetical protein